MKKLILLLTLFITSLTVNAQFDALYQQALKQQQLGQYYPAIKSYTAAIGFTSDKIKIDKAKKNIDYCAKKLNILLASSNELLKSFLPKGVTNIYAHFKTEGDKQFALGEYTEALKSYNLAKNAPDLLASSSILKDVQNTENCSEWQQVALDLIKQEKYDAAEKEILKVLKINPNGRKSVVIASAINPLYGMVFVQGGEFMMGSPDKTIEYTDDERPVHKVSLGSFEMSRYEITNLQYAVFLNKYGSDMVLTGEFKGEEMVYEHNWGVFKNKETQKWEAQKGYEYHPVISVTWYGANEMATFYGLSLPTEAQWEYAARGGAKAIETIYAGSNTIDEVAWYSETSKATSTFPVGLLKSNELNLYDMSGNVMEWCADWYSDYPEEFQKNPKSLLKGSYRVDRGGSWGHSAGGSRVAYRYGNKPNNYYNYLGFRLVSSLSFQ